MINSNKRSILLALISAMFTLFVMCGIPVSAEDYCGIVCDDYGVLTESEIDELNDYLNECSVEAQVNIAVVISDQTDKSGAMDFADVYEENLFGKNSNSILYLINMNDGYDWISCSGTAMEYYPESTIDDILYSTSGTYLTDDNMDFYGNIMEFGSLVISQQYEPVGMGVVLVISLVIALIVSIISCIVIASKYKFHAPTSSQVYAKPNSGDVTFTNRQDMFIKTYTSKVSIESESSSSSSHVSSGGGTHTGGGFQR